MGGWSLVQQVKGRSRRTSRRSRWRSRLIILLASPVAGEGSSPTLTFTWRDLASLSLAGSGRKSVRSLLLCLKPQHLCRVDKDKVQPTTSSSSSPAFPHNAAAAQCLANMDFSEAAASFTNSFTRNVTHNLRR